ncbi:MAG TPA: polysaccharide deacetylase [Chloroflexota bacterium]|jgi:peptidoglycan/xylan/chitin deacetylase (PgdA/CDA1 family)|nr:polysaccharide deacetylase [Chloroflexota bacterium]
MGTSVGDPTNRRVAVAFTFDFDAESAWLGSFKFDRPSALSRGAYGATEGVPRILRLLDRYNLPATFFIPGDTADRHPDETRAIVNAGHEIGHHGYLHEPPHLLTPEEERTMIERGLDALERIAGRRPRGYRSPAWELSNSTFSLLEEYGFDYDASQLGADRPYWVLDQRRQTNLVEVPSAWELTDSGHFMMVASAGLPGGKAPSHVEEVWREDFNGMHEEGGDVCFVLTMHPQIIGRPHRMRMLERMIQHITQQEGVWITQMGEIADDFRRRQGAASGA